MKINIFEKMLTLLFGETEQEIIQMEAGQQQCHICEAKLKGKKIFKVPTIDQYFCREHAKEEMDKLREQSFNAVPEAMKSKVHFSKEEAFFFICQDCQKHHSVLSKDWAQCDDCNEAICKEHEESHACHLKSERKHAEAEAAVPRRCEFCGRKIVLQTSVKCHKCNKHFCDTHASQTHHECTG